MRLQLCVLFVLCFGIQTLSLGENVKDGDTVARMTVEKTLEIAKSRPAWSFCRPGDKISESLNPEARSKIYQILDTPSEKSEWGNIVEYFGLIGQVEDCDKLEEYIKQYKNKKLDSDDESFICGVIGSMVSMEYRGISKAGTVIDKLIDPAYWEELNTTPGASTFVLIAVGCKSNAGDPRFKEKVKAILETIKDPRLKALYAGEVATASSNYDKFMKAKETGDWASYFGRPTPASAPTPLPTPAEDFYSSGTLWSHPVEMESSAAEALRKEAIEALEAALQAVAKKDMNYLITHTAEQGKPILLPQEQSKDNVDKLLVQKKALKELWTALIPVAQALEGKVKSPAQQSVYAEKKATALGAGIGAVPTLSTQPKKVASFIVVRFRYDDLKDVAKKYPEIFTNKGRIPSVSETGEPYVVMIWEGDQWYWNPFGM